MRMLLDRPRQWRPRAWLFQVHVWAGVLTAIYVIVSSLTGAALVFHEERAEPPPRAVGSESEGPVSADQAAETLRHALPGHWLWSFSLPQHPGGPYGGGLLGQGQYVFAQVHPQTGEVYRVVTRENSRWRVLADLHNNLLSGRTGRVVNGIGGLAVLVLCLTGLFIWWPGRPAWKRGLRVEWRARWPLMIWALHGAVGIWTLALIALISFTGLYHVWPQWFRSTVGRFAPMPRPQPRPSFPEAKGATPASATRLIASAQAAVPGRRVHAILFSRSPVAPIEAVMVPEGDSTATRADRLLLHPVTAQVVRTERYADRTAGDRLLRWLGPIHAGNFAGMWSKIVWCAAGLLMAVMAATGLIMWWNRVVRRRLAWKERAASAP